MRLLHPASLITSRRRRWRDHQAQALKQHDRTLRRCTPDELATLALAVLYVDVAAGVLQAAILEGAVDEDPSAGFRRSCFRVESSENEATTTLQLPQAHD
jgi:hypothetical protein